MRNNLKSFSFVLILSIILLISGLATAFCAYAAPEGNGTTSSQTATSAPVATDPPPTPTTPPATKAPDPTDPPAASSQIATEPEQTTSSNSSVSSNSNTSSVVTNNTTSSEDEGSGTNDTSTTSKYAIYDSQKSNAKVLDSSVWKQLSIDQAVANTGDHPFDSIKNVGNSNGNGEKSLYIGMLLIFLSICGFSYVILTTVMRRKRLAAKIAADSKPHIAGKKGDFKKAKSDTADIELPRRASPKSLPKGQRYHYNKPPHNPNSRKKKD
ncbi:MAG: hypothetical protein Q8876_03365 [Bacillota bacterium]|nr:hypothetical protein [Bacillota bacterium]